MSHIVLLASSPMASMASSPRTYLNSFLKSSNMNTKIPSSSSSSFTPTHFITSQQQKQKQKQPPLPPPLEKNVSRRELILRSSEFATLGAIFHFSGQKPDYLGVQKKPPALALCPATNNCVSTSENVSDLSHYAPPWNYNPGRGRGRENRVSREDAMKELLEVIKSTKPDNFNPKIVEKKDDYIRVEYESPILGFIDDVEFWFPPGNKPLVQYRSASRIGSFDFDINRKRIKALRVALEKKGWASEDTL